MNCTQTQQPPLDTKSFALGMFGGIIIGLLAANIAHAFSMSKEE